MSILAVGDGVVTGCWRMARLIAILGLVASSAGCILTKDLPDPALDIPEGYKSVARPSKSADTPPTLDWWRGFRSRELTQLMEEAQTVNLDIAAATARFKQADAQARITGAALLPSLSENDIAVGDIWARNTYRHVFAARAERHAVTSASVCQMTKD